MQRTTGVEIVIDCKNYSVINKTVMNDSFPPENKLSKNIVSTTAVADTGGLCVLLGSWIIKRSWNR